MKQTKFFLIVVVMALLATWARLVYLMHEDQVRYDRIENHSEITGIDTVGQ